MSARRCNLTALVAALPPAKRARGRDAANDARRAYRLARRQLGSDIPEARSIARGALRYGLSLGSRP